MSKGKKVTEKVRKQSVYFLVFIFFGNTILKDIYVNFISLHSKYCETLQIAADALN